MINADKLRFEDKSDKAELGSLDHASIHLAHDIEDTGIQEKYLRCQLTAQEPLTELDVKRFLVNTGTVDQVNISKLSTKEIAIILNNGRERAKREGKSEPYSIPLIINAGNEGVPPYPRWLSLVVTVNPLNSSVTYKVKAGYELSEQQKDDLANIIDSAIKFEDKGTDIEAYPRALLIPGDIKSYNNGRLCAYKALHALYNEDELSDTVSGNQFAAAFQAKSKMSEIIKAVYDIQLKAITLTPQIESLLTAQVTSNFSYGKIKAEGLGTQLNFLPVTTDIVPSQHALVLERISELQIYFNKIRFPGQHPVNPPLTSHDYQQFLLLTLEKFKSSGTNKVLNEMVISCYDDNALQGLVAYNDTRQPLPFTNLTLDFASLNLSAPFAKERFIFNLKTLLISMSENHLSSFTFINNNNQLTDAMIADLAKFISDRKIAIDITLDAKFQSGASQKAIDEAVADNIRERNMAMLGVEIGKEDKDLKLATGVVRKRPKVVGKQALSVDVELQQEQQVEVAVETSSEALAGTGQVPETQAEVYDMEQFVRNILELDGTLKNLVDGSSANEARDLWRLWTGALTNTEAMSPDSGIKISKAACEELFRYYDKFQYGLDLRNLPPGFMRKTDGNTTYIHFDDNYKKITVYNPLHVQATVLQGEKPLTTALFKKWLETRDISIPIKNAWERLSSAPYDKTSAQLFKKFLPLMVLLEDDELARLFELCFNENNSLNIDKFNFLMDSSAKIKQQLGTSTRHANLDDKLKKIFPGKEFKALEFIQHYIEKRPDFEHHLLHSLLRDNDAAIVKVKDIIKALPDVNLNALLQLYNDFGEKGFDSLKTLIISYPEILPQLTTQIFSKATNYSNLISDEYKTALEEISVFSDNERTWWNVLIAQHGSAQTDVNLVHMVNAFKEFKKELGELDLKFTPTCELKGVKSLPVALTRMLSILKHCKEENRQEQWEDMHKLDLSSTGAIKLISGRGLKEWAFISAEMHIDPATLSAEHNSYQSPSIAGNISDEDRGKMFEKFFRFVSYQEPNGQLPLAFYKHAHKKLDESILSDDIQRRMYPLIAKATTAAERVSKIKSLTSGIADIDHLIKLFVDSPIPGSTPDQLKEKARRSLLKFLERLDETPPLPVLNKLVTMISSSLNSLLNAARNGPHLLTAVEEFKTQTKMVNSSIYEGMKDYADIDYQDSELFFNYLRTVKKITDCLFNRSGTAHTKSVVNLLSTFKITQRDVDQIISAHFRDSSPLFASRRLEALNICRSISILEHPSLRALNTTDLINILEAVKRSPLRPVIEVIKNVNLSGNQRLSDYFPKYFLKDYSKAGIPEDVLGMIKDNFSSQQHQTHLKRILLCFSAPGDASNYRKIIEKIIAITKTKDSVDKSIFIAKLATAEGLYTNLQRLDQDDNNFLMMLDAIIAKKSTDEFIAIITAEHNLLQSCTPEQVREFFVKEDDRTPCVPSLSQKTALYIKTLFPQIRMMDNLAISELDLLPRIEGTLLRTPITEVNDRNQIDKLLYYECLDDALLNLEEQLKGDGPVDFIAVNEATDVLIANTSPTSHASYKSYSNLIRKYQEPIVDSKAREAVIKNPAMQKLIAFLIDPDTPSRYIDPDIKIFIDGYPSLRKNRGLIKCLINSPSCWQSMSSPSFLYIASQESFLPQSRYSLEFIEFLLPQPKPKPDLYYLGRVLKGLSKDLESLANIRQQTISLHAEISAEKAHLRYSYSVRFIDIFKNINDIAIANPSAKKQFLELYDRYLQHYSPAKHGELIPYLSNFVSKLEKTFAKTIDKNMVLSICLQFNNETEKELQPEGLLELLNAVERVPELHQATLLNIAVLLINNEKGYTLDGFKSLTELAATNFDFATNLAAIYKRSPFPTIDRVLGWHTRALASGNYNAEMKEAQKAYDKAPCHRELVRNGFHIEKAEAQLKSFEGFAVSQIDLLAFKAKTEEMRGKSTDELLIIYNQFNPKKAEYNPAVVGDYDTLVAVAAELFHRSKGKDKMEADGSFEMGSSMEINTTQYLAILSSLKTPGHVTSQIGTGEGKSRIMMISIACQLAEGKTVDFVTSDAQLATRDFVEYQAYFDTIGAKTSMIFANTDPSLYQIGGVNFSDPSNLSLFRNKARSVDRGEEVIDPVETNRALLLDEGDKTYFDVADTRFNFSEEGDESIRGMEWVYPLFMKYFAQESVKLDPPIDGKALMSPMELYFENIDISRENLLQFATNECSKQQLLRLKALSNSQIEQWQVSAVTASQLKFKEDYVIEADTLISTASGPKVSSEAQLLFSNRVSRNSKFSFGVHQFLHARLNLARQHIADEKDQLLREALGKCENPFYIQDEKQIIYSSTSKNLLDDYHQSTLKAVTGTSGSIIERQEASELYGLARDKMHFINVPRDAGLVRTDHPLRLTENQAQQINALIEQIKEARAKNQPILVIAENDEESLFLFKQLSEAFKGDEKIQYIHSQLSLKDEKSRIGKAGFPGQITVSTDMIGRGTDISLKGEAKKAGLNVIISYLPKTRDLEQIIGRSGRFGAKGDTKMILDEARLKALMGQTRLTPEFYSDVQKFILLEQVKMDKRSQCERLIKMTVGDFRKKLTDDFFEHMLKYVKKEDYKKLLPFWTTFFEKSDKAWNEIWPHIQKELTSSPIDVAKIDVLLAEYKTNLQKLWDTMRRNMQDVDISCVDGKKPIDKLSADMPVLVLSEKTKDLLVEDNETKGLLLINRRRGSGDNLYKLLLDDSKWMKVVSRLEDVVKQYHTPEKKYKAKLKDRGEIYSRIEIILANLSASSLIASGQRVSLLENQLEELKKIEHGINARFKKSTLKVNLQSVIEFYTESLREAAIGVDITELTEEVLKYESECLGEWSRYPALHGLRSLWWVGDSIEKIKKLPEACYNKEAVSFLNTIGPAALDERVLKVLQTETPIFNDQLTLENLQSRGQFLLALDEKVEKDSPKLILLKQLNNQWWSDGHIDNILALNKDLLVPSTINLLNAMAPDELDDNLTAVLSSRLLANTINEPITIQQLRDEVKKQFLGTLYGSYPDLKDLDKSWWKTSYIEKIKQLPVSWYTKDAVRYLNANVVPGVAEQLLKTLLIDKPEFGKQNTIGQLRLRGQFLLLLEVKLGQDSSKFMLLKDLHQNWWVGENLDKVLALSEDLLVPSVISLLNTINPSDLDDKLKAGLSYSKMVGTINGQLSLEELRYRGNQKLLLGDFSERYKELHNLNKSWWEPTFIEKIKTLPKFYYTEVGIQFLNKLNPISVNDYVLKALQSKSPSFEQVVDIRDLEKRGEFLLLLDQKSISEDLKLTLHNLSKQWWATEDLDKVLSLTENCNLTTSVIDVLNQIHPNERKLNDEMRAGLSHMQAVGNIDKPMEYRMLCRKGRIEIVLLRTLSLKDKERQVLHGLNREWWGDHVWGEKGYKYATIDISNIVNLPEYCHTEAAVRFFNEHGPKGIDDNILKALRNTTHDFENEINIDELRKQGKFITRLESMSYTSNFPILKGLKRQWWDSDGITAIINFPKSLLEPKVIEFLNTIQPNELDDNVIYGLKHRNASQPMDIEQLRRKGKEQFFVGLEMNPNLYGLKTEWWSTEHMANIKKLPQDIFIPNIIKFLNSISPNELDVLALNGLKVMRENGGLEDNLTIEKVRKAGRQPSAIDTAVIGTSSLDSIKLKISQAKAEYKDHVSSQLFSGHRAGFYKNKIMEMKLEAAVAGQDLNAMKRIILEAKKAIDDNYGSTSFRSWFLLTKTTSKSIELLDSLIKIIDDQLTPSHSNRYQ